MTKDLDFLIFLEAHSEQKAIQIVRSFGLHVNIIRKADLEGGPLFAIKKKNTPAWIIAGRAESSVGLDFLLPGIPWFERALARAEQNLIGTDGLKVYQ